jgi:hypothetical protein
MRPPSGNLEADALLGELPPPTAEQIRRAGDIATMTFLDGVLKLTILNFAGISVAHRYALPEPAGWIMSNIAVFTTVFLLASRFTLKRLAGNNPQRFFRTHHRLAQPIVGVIIGLVLFNCTAHQFFHRVWHESSNFLLMTVISGAVFTSLKYQLGFLAASWGMWIWAIRYSDTAYIFLLRFLAPGHEIGPVEYPKDPLADHYVFGMVFATTMCLVVFHSRMSLIANEEQLRQRYAELASIANSANMAKSEFLANVSHELR